MNHFLFIIIIIIIIFIGINTLTRIYLYMYNRTLNTNKREEKKTHCSDFGWKFITRKQQTKINKETINAYNFRKESGRNEK